MTADCGRKCSSATQGNFCMWLVATCIFRLVEGKESM